MFNKIPKIWHAKINRTKPIFALSRKYPGTTCTATGKT